MQLVSITFVFRCTAYFDVMIIILVSKEHGNNIICGDGTGRAETLPTDGGEERAGCGKSHNRPAHPNYAIHAEGVEHGKAPL